MFRLVVLGVCLIELELHASDAGGPPGPGDVLAERVGFVPSWGDQRWQPGAEL